jgi:hypothetical protein
MKQKIITALVAQELPLDFPQKLATQLSAAP